MKRKISYVGLFVLMLCLTVCFGMSASAAEVVETGECGAEGDNITYTLYDDGTLIISGDGKMAAYNWVERSPFIGSEYIVDVVIEEGVTNLSSCAFANCKNLATVALPKSLTSIGNCTFMGCSDIKDIKITANVATIGEGVFDGCEKLESITIPASLTLFGEYAFDGCYGLKDVYYEGEQEQWNNISGKGYLEELTGAVIHFAVEKGDCGAEGDNVTYIIYDDGKLVISGNGKMAAYSQTTAPFKSKNISRAVIDDGVKSIGAHTFYDCENITSVIIPETVTTIGDSAFGNCYILENVTIPYGVTSIGNSAFSSCYNFTNIIIPDSVTSIGIYAFLACKNITSIVIPDSVITLGRGAFDRCSAATSITIGKNVRSIEVSTFNDCEKVESIYIPASVTKIESSAFSGCYSLKEIEVDENNENYISEDGILFNKDKTRLVKYPSSREGTTYTVPESVESFGNYEAFGDCKYIEEVILGKKVTSLGDYLFQGCKNLKKVEFSGEITTINLGTFWGCSSLNDITIPDSVTSIKAHAFRGCISLNSITIPENVTSIGSEAFSICSTLENIIVDEQNNYYSDENGVLYNKDKSVLVKYPSGKKDSTYTLNANTSVIDGYALAYSTYLENVVLNQTVTEIKPTAFFGSSKLANVYCYGVDYGWREIFTDENNQLILSDGVMCFEFEDEVLIVSGLVENTYIRNSSHYPLSQYADSTRELILNDVASVGKNAFKDFTKLRTIIINDGSVSVRSGAFANCNELSLIVSYAEVYFNKDALPENQTLKCFIEQNASENTNIEHIVFGFDKETIYEEDEDGSIISFEVDRTFVNGDVVFTEYEFSAFVSALYYISRDKFVTLTFNSLKTDEDYIYEYTSSCPLTGEYTHEIYGTKIFGIVLVDAETDEYMSVALANLCDMLLSGEIEDGDWEFAVIGQKKDSDDGVEEDTEKAPEELPEEAPEEPEKAPNFIMEWWGVFTNSIAKIIETIKKLLNNLF